MYATGFVRDRGLLLFRGRSRSRHLETVLDLAC